MKRTKNFYRRGSALVTLAFFMLIGAVVTTAAVVILISSARSTSEVEQSLVAYQAAESGIDVGILRALRANYTNDSGSIGPATYNVSVSGNDADGTIISTGAYNGLSRTIRVNTQYISGVLKIISWQETY